MKNKIIGCRLCMFFVLAAVSGFAATAPGGYMISDGFSFASVQCLPDIKANGQDDPVTISTDTPVSLTAGLAPGDQNGKPADWWIAFNSPWGWYSLTVNGWIPGIHPLTTYPLLITNQVEIFNGYIPVGNYEFYFVVDMNPDGILDSPLYYDGVQLQVVQEDVHLSVPFEANHLVDKGCGTCVSSSFTMALRYYKPQVAFEDVFLIFGCPPFTANNYQSFMNWVNDTFPDLFAWSACNSSIKDIIKQNNKGVPVVVHQQFSPQESTGHNRVVIGYSLSQEVFILNDPSPLGADYRMDFDTFAQMWYDISLIESTKPYCMWVIAPRN